MLTIHAAADKAQPGDVITVHEGIYRERVNALADAAKKGPAGIRWFLRGGEGHRTLLTGRSSARLLKNLRMQRPQHLIGEMAKGAPRVRYGLWGSAGVLTLVDLFNLCGSVRWSPEPAFTHK